MSLEQNMAGIEGAAASKEATRVQARAEAATRRQESWNNLISGAKDKLQKFKAWEQQGGKDIRHAVDVAVGTKDAVVLTAQEKAIEVRDMGYDAANAVAVGAEAAKQGLGRAVIRGGEIAAGLVVLAVVGGEIAIRKTGEFVRDRIDDAVETADNVSDWLNKIGREIRDEAQELKQDAVDGFWGAVDRVRGDFRQAREGVTNTYLRVESNVNTSVNRTIAKGKEKIVAVHERNVDMAHDAIAGLHSLKARVAEGVADFFMGAAERATRVKDVAVESKNKQLSAKKTRREVAAVMAGE